jgi:hypothetical protein
MVIAALIYPPTRVVLPRLLLAAPARFMHIS